VAFLVTDSIRSTGEQTGGLSSRRERTVRYHWEADEWLTDPDIRAVQNVVQRLGLAEV